MIATISKIKSYVQGSHECCRSELAFKFLYWSELSFDFVIQRDLFLLFEFKHASLVDQWRDILIEEVLLFMQTPFAVFQWELSWFEHALCCKFVTRTEMYDGISSVCCDVYVTLLPIATRFFLSHIIARSSAKMMTARMYFEPSSTQRLTKRGGCIIPCLNAGSGNLKVPLSVRDHMPMWLLCVCVTFARSIVIATQQL